MRLQLITLAGTKLDQDIYELILPTASGDIAIYLGHEPLVTIAVPGVAKVRLLKTDSDDARDIFAINGGVVEVNPNEVKVLVDEADAERPFAQTRRALTSHATVRRWRSCSPQHFSDEVQVPE